MNIKTILEVVGEGLELIGRLVENRHVDDAARVLDAVQRVYEAIDDVSARRISPEEGAEELQRLRNELDANDAEADAALDAKFDTSDKE